MGGFEASAKSGIAAHYLAIASFTQRMSDAAADE
jgi:hypothetical protein